jgi:hypothetical protein
MLHPALMPLVMLQKSKPNNGTYTCRESQASNYPIGALGRKHVISTPWCMPLYSLSSGKVILSACTLYDGLAAITGHRNNNNNNNLLTNFGNVIQHLYRDYYWFYP